MAVDPAVAGQALLSVTQAVTVFQAFLPKFTDIYNTSAEENPNLVRDVRAGELGAVMLTLGIGAMASAVTGSAAPATVAAISSLGLVVLYESALRSHTEVNTDA